MNLMALLPTTMAKALVYNVATLFARLIKGIGSIVAQYDCNNNANNEDILKVLLHNLCALQTYLLYISISCYKLWLESAK